MRQSICVRRSLIIRLWRGEGSLPLRKVSKEIVEDEELKTLSENIGIQTFHNTKDKNTEIYERRALMGNSKHEDAIMKMGFRYFRDTILKLLGIDYTYVYHRRKNLYRIFFLYFMCFPTDYIDFVSTKSK